MKRILLLLLIGTVSSCTLQIWFKPKTFTYLYNGLYTGIDSLINIDGYYTSTSYPIKKDPTVYSFFEEKDSTVTLFAFYRDGLIRYMDYDYLKTEHLNMEKINSFHMKIKENYYKEEGTYKIIQDTIKAQTIQYYGSMMTPSVYEFWFLIKSKTKIELIFKKDLSIDHLYPEELHQLFYFHPYPNRIDSISYYKGKRWFWDKEAYRKKKHPK